MKSEIDFFKIETNHIQPRKGRVLISEPFLVDFYFKTSIVLITEHNKDGTIGFVLNKPIKMNIQDVMPEFPYNDYTISLGGPVSNDSIHYIHTLGEAVPGSIKVFDNIYWGGDFKVLRNLIDAGKVSPEQLRFFMGYSGWQPDQLESELKENSWLVTNIESDMIMKPSMDTIWQDSLKRLGERYKMWINSPEDPTLN